jgi:hypothetical protein
MGFDAKRKRRAYNAKHRDYKRVRRQKHKLELQKLAPKFGVQSPAGRYTKLTERVYHGICALLAEGQTIECSATLSGVDPRSVWNWLREGKLQPDGPFGQFARDVEYSREISHRYLVSRIADHDDWKASAFLLKNKFPKLYRDQVSAELSGPDGSPIPMSSQTFSVVLELHAQEPANERQPEREFRVEPANGASGALHVAAGLRGERPGPS